MITSQKDFNPKLLDLWRKAQLEAAKKETRKKGSVSKIANILRGKNKKG